eukprot:CAMPEP_0180131628 /NCGR_PEP_ID=MMETSP0986-20121125/8526_1 /TAXON_ID=697907 /ORGANISM="non described non described, Strain CCMP2293" /LENGTH=75 /DNA_ID=CAMNT_0022071527 /DNA_START=102 /DNA_END=330 /DNA_ORIENTATION=-
MPSGTTPLYMWPDGPAPGWDGPASELLHGGLRLGWARLRSTKGDRGMQRPEALKDPPEEAETGPPEEDWRLGGFL